MLPAGCPPARRGLPLVTVLPRPCQSCRQPTRLGPRCGDCRPTPDTSPRLGGRPWRRLRAQASPGTTPRDSPAGLIPAPAREVLEDPAELDAVHAARRQTRRPRDLPAHARQPFGVARSCVADRTDTTRLGATATHCSLCGGSLSLLSSDVRTVDHKVARATGGTNALGANLAACSSIVRLGEDGASWGDPTRGTRTYPCVAYSLASALVRCVAPDQSVPKGA